MCGRFNLTAPGAEIAEQFGLGEPPILKPRFNIAPSQMIAVVGLQPKTGRRGLAELRWGLLPQGAREGERRHINARCETAGARPAFRGAFARRRCLIPATGFYEWKRVPGQQPQPWLLKLASGRVFAFAGLWEPAPAAGGTPSCAILTTEPNPLAREIHDRMPVILDQADYAGWLDPALTSGQDLEPLLRPFPAGAMTAIPVNTAVNRAAFDDPSCVEPA
jgi:putative SOS response-associated peptidase YedK